MGGEWWEAEGRRTRKNAGRTMGGRWACVGRQWWSTMEGWGRMVMDDEGWWKDGDGKMVMGGW